MYQIGLVMHVTDGDLLRINKAYYVVFETGYEDQDLDKICSIENKCRFDQIILRR